MVATAKALDAVTLPDDFADMLRLRYGPGFFASLRQLQLPSSWRPPEGWQGGARRHHADGASLEFKHHRPYVEGDDPRKIDWQVYGRTRRLYTRVNYDERTPQLIIALDLSASMLAPSWREKYLTALDATVALAQLGLNHGFNVHCVPLVKGRAALQWRSERDLSRRAAEQLASLDPGGEADFSELQRIAHQYRSRGGVVLLLSDFLADGSAASNSNTNSNTTSAAGEDGTTSSATSSATADSFNTSGFDLSADAIVSLKNAVMPIKQQLDSLSPYRFHSSLLAISTAASMARESKAMFIDAETGEKLTLMLDGAGRRHIQLMEDCHHSLLAQLAKQRAGSFAALKFEAEQDFAVQLQAALVQLSEVGGRHW